MSMIKGLFAHDTEVALLGTAALVNTAGRDGDTLVTTEALDAFVRQWRWTGSHHHHGSDELIAVRALRELVRPFWEFDADEVAVQVNRMLRDAGALPQLVAHDDWPWHLHATPTDAPLADRMAVDAAMAMIDVVRQGELGRLRVCDADHCDHVLVDLSRNSSKRYCSTTCANRVNVAAYRSRRAEQGTRTG